MKEHVKRFVKLISLNASLCFNYKNKKKTVGNAEELMILSFKKIKKYEKRLSKKVLHQSAESSRIKKANLFHCYGGD